MTQSITHSGLKPAVQVETAEAAGTSRLVFVDHLRAALIILVVLHHVAMVYGGIQPFYYSEPPVDNLIAFLIPMAFVLMNQAWFMGGLFLIAGYFTPGSFDRKGSGPFLKGRLIRLGIPLLFWIFVLNPLSAIGYFLMPADLTGNTTQLTWQVFWQVYPDLLGTGPLWFVALLLIFSFGYVGWRILPRNLSPKPKPESSAPAYLQIVVFVLLLALASYLVRIVIPLGRSLFGFPTLAYLPQYLCFFLLGTVAYRRNWLRTLPGSMGVVGLVSAVIATLILFTLGFISFLNALENAAEQIPPFGFGTWQSGIYALWDSIFAVGMILAAITFFRRFFNRESRFGSFLAQQSYGVYIIHIPVIVYLAYVLQENGLGPFYKFSLVSLTVLAICFGVAYLIRKIPGVAKVV